MNPKVIKWAVALVVGIIFATVMNPFSFNESGYRTVVTQAGGKQFVQFQPGVFYAGFWSREQQWPNQISVSHRDSLPILELLDNTIEIGKVTIRFGDGPTALASGITQYILPNTEKEMLEIHNAHKTPEGLVTRRLAPYTQECLQNAAQLLTTEMHYSGGRAQMSQDYLDQLKNGAYLLKVAETSTYDSTEKSQKKIYQSVMQYDKSGTPKRKFSSIKEYFITVADAQITDVDYENAVDILLQKKIAAATEASVSKQKLMTAQQKQLTSEAEGKQTLVEIEYKQKQEQTKQVVAAQTLVELAKQDKEKQRIAAEAAELEARKIKTLADAEAYAKAKVMQADGALEKKLAAYVQVQQYWAEAFQKYSGNLVPTTVLGGDMKNNAGLNFMEVMAAKVAMDLTVNPKTK